MEVAGLEAAALVGKRGAWRIGAMLPRDRGVARRAPETALSPRRASAAERHMRVEGADRRSSELLRLLVTALT